jgi:hypothetical protein
MSARWLHNLTAIFLATLYGVIALSGESLHYLATEGWNLWSSERQVESTVYFHVHGPDFHGHFHRHTHHGSHSHTATEDVAKSNESTSRNVAFASLNWIHEPHACPILSLVFNLKLSHGGCCTTLIILDRVVAPTWEVKSIAAFETAPNFSPRGPPARAIA